MQSQHLIFDFNKAAACRINLPNSYEFLDLLSPETLEDLFNDYRMFINEMRKTVEAFLEKEEAKGKLSIATEVSQYGPIRTCLELQGPPETIYNFRCALEQIFAGFDLNDEWKQKGVTWLNLELERPSYDCDF